MHKYLQLSAQWLWINTTANTMSWNGTLHMSAGYSTFVCCPQQIPEFTPNNGYPSANTVLKNAHTLDAIKTCLNSSADTASRNLYSAHKRNAWVHSHSCLCVLLAILLLDSSAEQNLSSFLLMGRHAHALQTATSMFEMIQAHVSFATCTYMWMQCYNHVNTRS